MDKFYGVLFNRKSGKIVKSLEGVSSAMLKLFALQGNVSSTRDYASNASLHHSHRLNLWKLL